jgi:hypothetical protein
MSTAGKPFRIKPIAKPLMDVASVLPHAAHLTRSDLDRPCCHVCFTPIPLGEYCSKHLADGSADRHRKDPARRMVPS